MLRKVCLMQAALYRMHTDRDRVFCHEGQQTQILQDCRTDRQPVGKQMAVEGQAQKAASICPRLFLVAERNVPEHPLVNYNTLPLRTQRRQRTTAGSISRIAVARNTTQPKTNLAGLLTQEEAMQHPLSRGRVRGAVDQTKAHSFVVNPQQGGPTGAGTGRLPAVQPAPQDG